MWPFTQYLARVISRSLTTRCRAHFPVDWRWICKGRREGQLKPPLPSDDALTEEVSISDILYLHLLCITIFKFCSSLSLTATYCLVPVALTGRRKNWHVKRGLSRWVGPTALVPWRTRGHLAKWRRCYVYICLYWMFGKHSKYICKHVYILPNLPDWTSSSLLEGTSNYWSIHARGMCTDGYI